jgi:hypothetical protein
METLYDMALAENGGGQLLRQLSPIHGHGLFTIEDLSVNTILCRRLGLKTTLSLRDKRAIIGIDGLDAACMEDAIFKNINHSCQPNAFLTDTGCLINFKKLSAGTEITVDYAALLTGSDWQMSCRCGQSNCLQKLKSL